MMRILCVAVATTAMFLSACGTHGQSSGVTANPPSAATASKAATFDYLVTYLGQSWQGRITATSPGRVRLDLRDIPGGAAGTMAVILSANGNARYSAKINQISVRTGTQSRRVRMEKADGELAQYASAYCDGNDGFDRFDRSDRFDDRFERDDRIGGRDDRFDRFDRFGNSSSPSTPAGSSNGSPSDATTGPVQRSADAAIVKGNLALDLKLP